MGKFVLKDSQKELGKSYFTAVCPVGSRVSSKYRFGDIAIMFDEIRASRVYLNSDVLRKALLDNPEKTERLLKIKVIDIEENIVTKPKKGEVIESKDDIEPKKGVVIVSEEDNDFLEPEVVSNDEVIEDITEPFELEIEEITPGIDLVNLNKDELVKLGKEHNLEVNIKMKKDDLIATVAQALNEGK